MALSALFRRPLLRCRAARVGGGLGAYGLSIQSGHCQLPDQDAASGPCAKTIGVSGVRSKRISSRDRQWLKIWRQSPKVKVLNKIRMQVSENKEKDELRLATPEEKLKTRQRKATQAEWQKTLQRNATPRPKQKTCRRKAIPEEKQKTRHFKVAPEEKQKHKDRLATAKKSV